MAACFEITRVSVVPFFECALGQTNVFHFRLAWRFHRGFIDYTCLEAVLVEGAVFWLPTVAFTLRGRRFWRENLGVVALYYLGHVWHTRIGHFGVIAVEQFVVWVPFGEVSVQ